MRVAGDYLPRRAAELIRDGQVQGRRTALGVPPWSMRSRIKTMLSVWAGLITAATMGASAAVASTATVAQETFLVIGVQDGGGQRFATLRCDPASGTHPHPVSACRVLREAGGDFTKIVGKAGTLCPALHEPVTASASGAYLGGQVVFRRTYSNRCDLARHTGPVFEL